MAYVSPKRGVVLVLVLGIVALLSIVAVRVSQQSSVCVMQQQRRVRDGVFDRGFLSGRAVALSLLSKRPDSQGFDFFGDGWNVATSFELEPGVNAQVQVQDESGKLNIVAGMEQRDRRVQVKRMLSRLFSHLRQLEPHRGWDDAEGGVLRRLGFETEQRPEPLLSLDGLREAGLTIDQVYGDAAMNLRGLADFLTVHGDAKLNINTASVGALYALDDELDLAQAQKICLWRGDLTGDPAQQIPFKKTQDLGQALGLPVDSKHRKPVQPATALTANIAAKVQDRISVRSTAFSARITVTYSGKTRQAWAYFEAHQSGTQPSKLIAYEEIEP